MDMQGIRPEIERINYLLQRDGEKATRAWVERTLRIYREAITKPGSHASNTTYRPLFEKAIHEFEEWLATRREGDAKQTDRVRQASDETKIM
jgi:hypothetical protein